MVVRKKVLCVDDESGNLAIRTLLLTSAGYEVISADSGAEGLSILEKCEVDVVVLDYAMPEMNGLEAAHRIRRLKPTVPILMLSGQLKQPDGVDGNVDAYLCKGGDTRELLDVLSELTSKRPARRSSETQATRKRA